MIAMLPLETISYNCESSDEAIVGCSPTESCLPTARWSHPPATLAMVRAGFTIEMPEAIGELKSPADYEMLAVFKVPAVGGMLAMGEMLTNCRMLGMEVGRSTSSRPHQQ